MCGTFTHRQDAVVNEDLAPSIGPEWGKKVVYGPNADVKGIVVLIYSGPVAGL